MEGTSIVGWTCNAEKWRCINNGWQKILYVTSFCKFIQDAGFPNYVLSKKNQQPRMHFSISNTSQSIINECCERRPFTTYFTPLEIRLSSVLTVLDQSLASSFVCKGGCLILEPKGLGIDSVFQCLCVEMLSR